MSFFFANMIKVANMEKAKNWKSTLAFIIFVGIFIYSVVGEESDGVVETTGYVALFASIAMMFRSQITTDILKSFLEGWKK